MSGQQSLRVQGWLVAEGTFEPSFMPRWAEEVDEVRVFRHAQGWTTLVISRRDDYDRDSGEVIGGQALVETRVHSDVAGLRADVEGQWGTYEWWQLLDAGHERDLELYRLWVPGRMERDLDRSSLYPRDLAPGQDPLEAMAGRLAAEGWDMAGTRPAVTAAAARANRTVGALVGRRYGWQAPIVVRVDDFGEVYARLADPREVRAPGLRELSDQEREEHRKAREQWDVRGWEQ